jgi:poly(3-hydroxybutyrate) depolymerase
MNRILLCLFFSLVLPVSATAASDKIVKETTTSAGRPRTYYLFAPASIKAPAPLIVLLHGSGRNGNSLAEKWKDLAAKEGIVLVGPDALDPQEWSIPADGPQFLHELVESLKKRYQVNPRRVYLFGHSAGAVFALHMSMLESQYFAATAIHAGAWREQQHFQLIDYAERKIPLAVWVGDNDAFFPLAAVKETNDRLKERGFPIETNIMRGHTHWYYNLAPQINRQAWEFLRRNELPGDPIYTKVAQAK